MNESRGGGYFSALWRRAQDWIDGVPPAEEPDAPDGEVRLDPSDAWLKRAEPAEKSAAQRLAVWNAAHGTGLFQSCYRVIAALVCVTVIITLLLTVSFLPTFGNPDNPANNEVSTRYLEQGTAETGAVNIVAAMILDYRAFDTLGEAHVLLIAAYSVVILLRLDTNRKNRANIPELEESARNEREEQAKTDTILRRTAFFLLPVVFLYGIYVVLNGHLSAGGGFSGGAILGAGLILYRSAYGTEKIRRFFRYGTFKWVSFGALITYCCLKGYSFYMGANHLASGIPLGTPGAILSAGLILPLNICVGCVVACTLYGFYALFCEGGI